MQQVWPGFLDHRLKVLRRSNHVRFGIEHPLEFEGSWTIVKILQRVHPPRLRRRGNIAEADQSYAFAASQQASDQLPRVCPNPAQRVSRDYDVHAPAPQ